MDVRPREFSEVHVKFLMVVRPALLPRGYGQTFLLCGKIHVVKLAFRLYLLGFRRGLSDKDIQAILFEWPSGSECFDMDSSDDERIEAEPSSKGPIDKYIEDSSDDEDLEVEQSSTVKNKAKRFGIG